MPEAFGVAVAAAAVVVVMAGVGCRPGRDFICGAAFEASCTGLGLAVVVGLRGVPGRMGSPPPVPGAVEGRLGRLPSPEAAGEEAARGGALDPARALSRSVGVATISRLVPSSPSASTSPSDAW